MGNKKWKVLSLRALLGRRDWFYLLSLMVPFIAYNLALKALDIASRSADHGFARTLDLMQSTIFFNMGYTLLWIWAFAVVRRRREPVRRAVIVVFHAMAVLVMIITTSAHLLFQETGMPLDYSIIVLYTSKPEEIAAVLAHGDPLLAWIPIVLALCYAALGPWFVRCTIERWEAHSGRPSNGIPKTSFLSSLVLFLLALGSGSLSLLVGISAADASESLARDPFVNVLLTGVANFFATDAGSTSPDAEHPPAHVKLAQTPQTEKRNVVLIHLESTRAQSLTLYNEYLKTTPFLDELAKGSLLAEQDYTTVPHTSKASVSVNCGIEPRLVPQVYESLPGAIPAQCLAGLLKNQGYSTVFFQSSTEDFENFRGLVKNFGYEEYYPLESMNTEGFKWVNYFGYEDDIMLGPSEAWLEEHKNEPFMAEYLTGTGHHDYQCLGLRYGDQNFSEDDQLNRYLNCIRYQDFFVQNLFDQYKKLGLYDNTIFVIYGDHGEGFGEHGRRIHDGDIYEEGLRVPLIIHAPGWFENGEHVKGLSNHTDILPTVLEMLGYEVKNGKYPGYSLLHPLPKDRTLMFSCFNDSKYKAQCLASLQGPEKYIYHYDGQPDEIFDLSEDPLEKHNLASKRSEEEIDKRREDLLAHRSEVDAMYGDG